MNVGISVFTRANANVWSSGVNQNLAFLVLLLRQLPSVEGLYLINGGDADVLPAGMPEVLQGVPLVKPQDVTHRVDVVIEMGAQLPIEWMRYVRALGKRIVLFVVGQAYAGAAENPLFGRTGGLTFTGSPWQEVWMLTHHAHTSAAMLRTLARVPVHELPHLWFPAFLQRTIEDAARAGHAFGFDAQRRAPGAGWRAGIFEPNISVVKNCTVPMLACEQAYRQDRKSIELMMVMNAMHMKEHPSFNSFAASLDLTRDSRASYEPRLAFADCMARHRLDAVVSHHWECGLNYLYYDALHGGYPLVHNSEYLRRDGVGLYYPGFGASEAARVLVEARRHDADFWSGYARSAQAFLRTLAPDYAPNMDAFARRLTA